MRIAAEYDSDEKKQIFDVLGIDYLVVALCDFDEGTLVNLKQAERSNLDAVNQALGEDNHSFSERIRYYYDHFVIKESAPDFLEKMDLAYLRSYLEDHDRFVYPLRTVRNPAGHQFFDVQIVPLRGSSKFVMGFRYMDELAAEREPQRRIKDQYEQRLTENHLALAGLSTDYTIAFLVNVDTDDYEIVFYQETNHAKTMEGVKKFSEYVERYVESVVLPQSKEIVRRTLSTADMKKQFEKESDYFFSFETIPNGAGLSCFQGHIVKEYTENGRYALLGFRSVDEVVQQERYYVAENGKGVNLWR